MLTFYNQTPKGFMDTYKSGMFEGLPIFRKEEVDRSEEIIIANDDPYVVVSLYERLSGSGYRNLYWFLNMDDYNTVMTDFLSDECLFLGNWGKCILPDLEVHIADNCNLNCKGCTHFSPLFDSVGVNFESRINDIEGVRGKVDGIARLDILGGEPLLNHELDKYASTIRHMLPDTRISIFSNGILIPKLSDESLKVISDNNIGFMISLYMPTEKIMGKIKQRLNDFNIRYKLTVARGKFNLPITIKKDTSLPHKCISNGCVSISDGKIARCPTLLYVHKFNEAFNERLPENGIYSIKDCPSGDDLRKLMKKEVPLCKFCVLNEIDWDVCGKDYNLDDFASNQ